MKTYSGSCHCGAVSFAFEHEEIQRGLRCNCSICRRKGAIMSVFTLHPEALDIHTQTGALGVYRFGTKTARHYFCRACGIYPFHATLREPGHYRVNLGCIDDIDPDGLEIDVFDGKHLF